MTIPTSTSVSNAYSAARDISNLSRNSEQGNTLQDAARDFTKLLYKNEEKIATSLISGADPEILVQAIAETELAIETTVALRNKVVEAYQEILRMPV
ncbi:MAG: flagellar hook-basal body complex protein FliE [Dinoroseobacter sp.]|nr:flagellar hook-basal body complex protein FliE [Dinoroseobacter sp.]